MMLITIAVAKQLCEHLGSGGICLGCLDVGRVESDGGLAVVRHARSECLMNELAHLGGRLAGYERAFGLGFGQGESGIEAILRSGEKHSDAEAVHSTHIIVIAWCAASASHHYLLHLSHLEQGVVLHLAKLFFAVACKEVADGAVVLGFDIVVEVDKAALQFLAKRCAERGFATSHVSY